MYWYRPWPQFPQSRLADEVLRPGDRLTVHSLSTHKGEPLRASPGHYHAMRDLPEAPAISGGSFRWAVSRLGVYTRRARLRHRAVSEGDYDVCHVFGLNYFTDAWALQRLNTIQPLVSTVHDVLPHEPRVPPALERRLLASVYRSAGKIVVAHEYLKRQLIAQFHVTPGRIETIPLPVHIAVDSGASEPPGPATVLFFGHFRTNKGVNVLLDAIRRLGTRDVRFLFVGRGQHTIEQAVHAAAEKDSRIIAQIGFVPKEEISSYFVKSHLIVLPYTSFASQSGVLSDAYGHLVPIVGTDVGALGGSIRDDGSGWVVPPGDSESLAEALESALEDQEARLRAREAIARVRESRTFDAIGRAHRDLYARLLA